MPDPLGQGVNGSMSEALIALSAALGSRDPGAIRAAVKRAAIDADSRATEEVLLQSHLFVGFPDTLNALAIWREETGRPAPTEPVHDEQQWRVRGERICATVYGDNYERLRKNIRALHPDIDQWMVVGGYGRVLGREGLDLVGRELCLVALLAVWCVPRQLHSHLRGALNAGATIADIDRVVDIACSYLDAERADAVRSLWAEVKAKTGASVGSRVS